MTNSQKIWLGCGGASCLATIVVVLIFGGFFAYIWSQFSGIQKTTTRTYNVNSNTANSNSNSPGPFATFANRTGRYEGKAANIAAKPIARGNAVIDVSEIDSSSGDVSMRMSFSGKLCGEGTSTGKITSDGVIDVTGNLRCSVDWRMVTRCKFTDTSTLLCSYKLLPSAGGTTGAQEGAFEVKRMAR